MPAWTKAAREELLRVASDYQRVITYTELWDHVQEVTGLRTNVPMRHGVGKLLASVVHLSHAMGDPPITSLCVRQDGTIGDGYVFALEVNGQSPPHDLEMQAAEDRLTCYQQLATNVPSDGGKPYFTAEVRRKRDYAARATSSRPKIEGAMCPNCNTQMPLTGVCDNCG